MMSSSALRRTGQPLARTFVPAVLAAAFVLAGCAGGPAADTSPDIGVSTPSDETEGRRRARIRLELAIGYFEQDKVEIALDEIKQVVAADPSFADAYNMRGLIYMRLNELALAEDSFRRALAISPRDANTLHNLGWLQCQQRRYLEAYANFEQAMAHPLYAGRAKTLMSLGLCQARDGRTAEAERSLLRAYELDAGNPLTGYNLATLLFRRGEFGRAQFYIRRLNNSELANAESLWLGIRVERRMNNREAMQQLGDQLRKRFPASRELAAYEKEAFDE